MNKRLLNVKELSEYAGIKVNTVYSWVNRRKIPYVKVGRLVKFDLNRIEEWIEENSVDIYDKY